MTLIEHLRGWDEMPEDDSEAFRWLDLKTTEAADELEFLQQQLVAARRTAEYWKANHLSGNEQLAACERQRDELKADAERYQELLYAVQRKFPNESRHETALRYIKHAEAPSYSNAAKESK